MGSTDSDSVVMRLENNRFGLGLKREYLVAVLGQELEFDVGVVFLPYVPRETDGKIWSIVRFGFRSNPIRALRYKPDAQASESG